MKDDAHVCNVGFILYLVAQVFPEPQKANQSLVPRFYMPIPQNQPAAGTRQQTISNEMKKFLCLIVASALAMVVSAQEVKENVTVKVKGGYELKGSVEQNGDSVKITTENGDVFVYRSNEIVSIADASGNVQKKGKEKGANSAFSQKGYMGYVDLSAGYELYWHDGALFQFTTTHGYRCTPHVFVGGGLGVGIMKPTTKYTYHEYWDTSTRIFIPIYATCRVSLLKNRKVSPYIGVNVGYNIDIIGHNRQNGYNWGLDNESFHGFMIDPSVGIEIASKKRLALFIAINCNMILNMDTGYFLSGKIGVAF